MINGLNIFFIALYFIIVLYIGIRASKRENDEGYLLANRNVGFFVLTATFVASIVGGNFIVTSMAFVFEYGGGVVWSGIGTLLGFTALAFMAPKIKRLSDKYKFYTMPDFLYQKYGKGVSLVSSLIIFIGYIGFLLIQFIAGGVVLSAITGWSYIFSVLLMGVVVIIYITAAGFKAVIRTDVFQYLIILFLIVFGVIFLTKAGTSSIENIQLLGAGPVNTFAFVLYGFVLTFIGADMWQRLYAGKSAKTVKKSAIFAGFIVLAILSFVVFMGLAVKAKFPDIVPETALVVGFTNFLPQYLIGFGLVILFAAIMSSLDTFIFVLSTSFSKDFLGKFERFSRHDLVKVTRIFAILIGVIGMLLAFYLSSVVQVLIPLAGIYFTIFPVIIFSFKYNLKKKAAILSLIGGFLSSVIALAVMGIAIESALVGFPMAFIFLGLGQLIFKR
jgi:SSS family solute:Na+ symporter